MGTAPLLSYFNRESSSPSCVGRLASSYTKEVPAVYSANVRRSCSICIHIPGTFSDLEGSKTPNPMLWLA